MNEQLQRLTRSADRPGVVPQMFIRGRPLVDFAELSANLGEPGSDAVRQDAVGTRHLRNDVPLDGGKERYPCGITRRVTATAPPVPHWCKEITPKTTESHWSGGQREP